MRSPLLPARSFPGLALLGTCLLFAATSKAAEENHGRPLPLQRGDVIAFLGGGDVAAAQETGHLEALLAIQNRGLDLHCRNFGWEGDTVFSRPRDVGFPPLAAHLRRAAVLVVVLQFGRTEALSESNQLPDFGESYRKLLAECAQQTGRLILVTPPPFEPAGELLPDLSERNRSLARFAMVIQAIGREGSLPVIDLFAEFGGEAHRARQLTDNGLQLTPRGQALIARALARRLSGGLQPDICAEVASDGAWPNEKCEKVRQAVIAKNRLWFNYWRPQNWAFLGGDRIEQPSSRDHRDRNVRWFPAEIERFVPLIQSQEREVARLARAFSD